MLGPENLQCRLPSSNVVPTRQKNDTEGGTYQLAFDRLLGDVTLAEKQVRPGDHQSGLQSVD